MTDLQQEKEKMITEERLKEIETDGRAAMPLKAELQEMVAAYRGRIPGLRVTKSDGEVWFHFDSPVLCISRHQGGMVRIGLDAYLCGASDVREVSV